MKVLLNKLRIYLIKKLSVKQVIATKLEGMTLRNERVTHLSCGFYELPGRKFGAIHIHYIGGELKCFDYDNLEKMVRDYTYLSDVFISQEILNKKTLLQKESL